MTAEAREPNFDRVARIYRWAEYAIMGSTLQGIRTHFIPALQGRRYAVAFGDGDGRFVEQLLRGNGSIHVTALDISHAMLKLLTGRCTSFGDRLETSQVSALDFMPARETDLIVSHFFLDCLSQQEVEGLISRIADTCKPGTRWLISDFQEPAGILLRHVCRLFIRLLYAAFRMLTSLSVKRLPRAREALEAANFRRIAYHQTTGGLLYSEIWELCQSPQNKDAQPETAFKHPLELMARKV